MEEIENIHVESLDYYLAVTAIELLGDAKNALVDAEAKEVDLPPDMGSKLHQAYRLIDEVQEYLYG